MLPVIEVVVVDHQVTTHHVNKGHDRVRIRQDVPGPVKRNGGIPWPGSNQVAPLAGSTPIENHRNRTCPGVIDRFSADINGRCRFGEDHGVSITTRYFSEVDSIGTICRVAAKMVFETFRGSDPVIRPKEIPVVGSVGGMKGSESEAGMGSGRTGHENDVVVDDQVVILPAEFECEIVPCDPGIRHTDVRDIIPSEYPLRRHHRNIMNPEVGGPAQMDAKRHVLFDRSIQKRSFDVQPLKN
ncbi:MAG: hypothetical protein BWY82_03036 [Verrucomicrobia bacterium ADurb.Bin474]|nr:MAG: hypothetical protein BWY82_03036 [Verrucomicrobia bacterium ADurb.Bin474]